jgi:hypothetical protein
MSKTLTYKDWVMISAFLDNELSPADVKRIENRRKADPEFQRSLDEIAYTRRLLHSLPQKRAPRNFTLSTANVKNKTPRRNLWIQPALSFVSIAAALALVVIFAGSYLLPMMGSPKTAAYAPEMAADRSNLTAEVTSTPPAIINWNPVLGMGGGNGSDSTKSGAYSGGIATGMGGGPATGVGGGASEIPIIPQSTEPTPEPTVGVLTAPLSTAVPESTAQIEAPGDLSNLILGLPNPEEEGKIIEPQTVLPTRANQPLSIPGKLMIVSGIIAVLAGAAALILRRR